MIFEHSIAEPLTKEKDLHNRISVGKRGELIVAQALIRAGWTVRQQNFRHIGTEIDIIATKGKTLIVVEVKSRGNYSKVHCHEQMISSRKLKALSRGIGRFLTLNPGLANSANTIRLDLAIVVCKPFPRLMDYQVNFRELQYIQD